MKKMNNLEKKQTRLEKLKEQWEKSRERTEKLSKDIRDLEKQIEIDLMADIFREGKTYKMTVSDWLRMRGDLSEFMMNQKISENTTEPKNNTQVKENDNEN